MQGFTLQADPRQQGLTRLPTRSHSKPMNGAESGPVPAVLRHAVHPQNAMTIEAFEFTAGALCSRPFASPRS